MGGSGRMRSVEATRAVWQTNEKLTRSELLVLQALASHASEHFECYPSLDRLATMTRLSKRQVIRILRGLRKKGHIAFEENHGGRRKCNHYRLLIAANGDIKSDTNGDIANGDTLKNGVISHTETVTARAETVTDLRGKGDVAMSPEGFNGLEGVRSESGQKLPPPVFRGYNQVVEELESNPGKVLGAILSEGIPVTRNEVCDEQRHGPFVRHGWLWGNWIVWAGARQIYSSSFSEDAGCPGCKATIAERSAKHPDRAGDWNARSFEVRSAAICPTHGGFLYEAFLLEYGAEYEKHTGTRYRVSSEICRDCESEMVEEMNLQDQLQLSNEEMERGCEPILAAVDYARGLIDSSFFLSVLQNRIIPDLEGKRATEERTTLSVQSNPRAQ